MVIIEHYSMNHKSGSNGAKSWYLFIEAISPNKCSRFCVASSINDFTVSITKSAQLLSINTAKWIFGIPFVWFFWTFFWILIGIHLLDKFFFFFLFLTRCVFHIFLELSRLARLVVHTMAWCLVSFISTGTESYRWN